MMIDTFTIDGVTLEAAGVSSFTIDLVNQGEDVCRLRLVDVGTPRRTWSEGQRVQINRDGWPFFTGWVSQGVGAETQGDTGLDVVLSGPWWWLKRIVFGRRGTYFGVPYEETTVNLFITPEGRSFQSVASLMQEVCNWAASMSGGAFRVGTINPGEPPGTPPPQWVTGEYCDAVVKKVAAWAPEAVMWVDYKRGVPILNWTRPGSRVGTHSFSRGTAPLTAASASRDDSLAPAGIVIRYDAEQGDYQPVAFPALVDSYPPGMNASTPGAAVITLQSSDYVGIKWAQKMWAMTRAFLWSASVTTAEQILDIVPGDMVSVSGRPEWAGNSSIIQRVNFDSARRAYSITAGPPSQLGITDLNDLFWYLKLKQGSQTPLDAALSLTPWQPYLHEMKTSPYGIVVRIAPGFVNDGTTSVSPTWEGLPLNADEPPFVRFRTGFSEQYYLKVEWLPDRQEFTGYDSLGNYKTVYRVKSTGTIVSATIETRREDNVAPLVGIETGRVTRNGLFWFPLAVVEEVNGELRVTQNRSTDVSILFIPPNNVYLLQ